ncbi:MAG TPA: alpha/beta hydrolase [Gemmatimonadales bacterium]|nr:alpha/beta hydrolase [Gemmatimonadales bacterium]HEV8598992.1 alpha/beta hydrolase [Gemmatimonadales bacterium]
MSSRIAAAGALAAFVACTPVPATTPQPVEARAATLAAGADQYFERNEVRLRYRDVGQGGPVVLLHGYTQRIELMATLADSLSGAYRVIVLDERGFGKSTKSSDPRWYGRPMVEDVIGLLDRLSIRRAHVIGHSMGALLAANLALRYPDRVASVSLLAGPFFSDSVAFAAMSTPYVQALERGQGLTAFFSWLFPSIPDSIVAGASTQLLAENDLGSLIGVLRAMGGLMVSAERAHSARVPALVAVGTADPLLPQSRAVAALWPGARLLVVPDAHHAAVLAHGAVVAAIREVLPTPH